MAKGKSSAPTKGMRAHWKPIAIVIIIGLSVTAFFLMPREAPKSKITVSGAFALYPMMVKWAEEYQKIHPDVVIDVSAGGAGKGMSDVLAGLVDIGMISRSITQEEINKGAYYVAVTKDAVVITINSDNPVLPDLLAKGINKDNFYGIFITGSVTKWGQVVGTNNASDIHVYTRSDSCGAADTWAKYLGKTQDDLTANSRATGVFGDPGELAAIQADRLAIGYNNIGYAYDLNTKSSISGTRPVPIDINGNRIIDENEKLYDSLDTIVHAIQTGVYPSPPARNELLATNKNLGGWNATAKAFINWILTDGQQYVPEMGYVNLPQDTMQQQLDKLKNDN